MMFRREILEDDKPFREEFVHIEDYELWTRLVKRTCAATLPVPLVKYRVHGGSICTTHREEQIQRVKALSARQIGLLFPQRQLTKLEIEALHRCYHLQQLTQQDITVGSELMFQLFKVFEQQPGIETDIVRKIQRQWIKRMLASISAKQWGSSGLLKSILRYDPIALIATIFIHLPKHLIHQVGQLLRVKKSSQPLPHL
jgi:hypothetical protein